MKRNTLFLLAAILAVVILLASTAFAEEGEIREVADLEKLNEAIADPNVDTIKLTQNIENVDSPITITRSLTLDLGTHTISGKTTSKGILTILSKGIEVTIKNGNVVNDGYFGVDIEDVSASLTLDNVDVTTKSNPAVIANKSNSKNSKIHILSGTIKSGSQFPLSGLKGMEYFLAEGVTVISTNKSSGMTPNGYISSSYFPATLTEGCYADVKINEDGSRTLTIKRGEPPCVVGEKGFYHTLKEAVEAGDEKVYYTEDMGSEKSPMETVTIPEGKTLKLYLLSGDAADTCYYGDIVVNGTLEFYGSSYSYDRTIIGNITFGDEGKFLIPNESYYYGVFSTDLRGHLPANFSMVETSSDYTEQQCWEIVRAYIKDKDNEENTYISIDQALKKGVKNIKLYNNHVENIDTTGVEGPITIDLNNNTLRGGITGYYAAITVAEGTELTVTNGNIISGPGYHHAREYAIENHGTLTLDKVKVNGVTYNGNMPGVVGSKAESVSQNALIRSDGAQLTIKGCTIDNRLMLPPYPYGHDTLGPLDEGDEYDGGLGVLVYGGKATIEDSTISGGFNGVYASGGHIEIKSGTIKYWTSNIDPSPDGKRHVDAVDAAEDSMISITGGYFNSNVSRFVAEGHIAKKWSGGETSDSCQVVALDGDSVATSARVIFLKDVHTEGENTYQIILESTETTKSINKLKTATLSFNFENEEHHLTYEIKEAANVKMTKNEDGSYTFTPAGEQALSGHRVVLGTVTFSGIGKSTFACKESDNSATATQFSGTDDLTLSLTVNPTNEDLDSAGQNLTAYGKVNVEIKKVTVKAGEDYPDPVSGAVFSNKSETDATLTYGEGDSITVEGKVTAKLPNEESTLTVGGTKYTADEAGVELVIDGSTVNAAEGCTLKENTVYKNHTVTLTVGAGGKAEIAPETAIRGDTITVTVTEIDEGYKLIGVVAVGGTEDIKVTKGVDGKHTFTMPAADVTVNVSFAADITEGDGITIVEEPTINLPDDLNDIPGLEPEDLNGTDVTFDPDSLKDVGNAVTEDDTTCTTDNAKKKMEEENVAVTPEQDIYFHVLTDVNITVKEFQKDEQNPENNILTLEITPVITVVASTEPDIQKVDDTNSVTLAEEDLTVSRPVQMVLPVPEGFANEDDMVFIKHIKDGGKAYWYTDKVDGGVVSFTNPHGFSTFEIHSTPNAEARIGEQYYDTLQDAVNAAKDGDVIELNKDCSEDVTVSRTVEFTLKKGNHEFTGNIKGVGYYAVTKGDEVGDEIKYTVYYAGPYTYSVKTEAAENVELKVSATSVPTGETVTVTPTPAENYHVSAVTVTASNGADVEVTDNKDGTYTFKMPASNVTVTAAVYECPSLAFPDIDLTQWYHPYTDYAIANNLMKGTDLGFEPEKLVTRAQMAGILWTLYGSPKVDYEIPFPDVPENEWYTEAIRWAASEGIIKGYDTGKFGPNDTINREQMATMLYNYEQKLGAGGFTGDWMFNLPFDDAADISDWAFEAVAWCSMKEVIKGDNNKFNPADTSNRAQLATILSLYDQLTK